jgi:hypothetical protein
MIGLGLRRRERGHRKPSHVGSGRPVSGRSVLGKDTFALRAVGRESGGWSRP